MVTNAGERLYLVVNGAVKHEDIGFLREYLPDTITINHMDDAALLALQGPKSAEALARIGIGPAQSGWPVPTDLYFMEAGPFLWNGIELGISRSGYTGEDGFEISVAAQHVAALADVLCAQPEVKPVGLGARDSLRLEAGLPLYGHDMNPANDPVEANAAFAISKRRRAEGGFHGERRILAALEGGPVRKLVGFTVDGRLPVREGAILYVGDTQVGLITSGGFAPSIGAPIAMGYVAIQHIAIGTALEAEVRGKRVGLTVCDMPFVAHNYHRRGAVK
jgi:aminomethyltransferase